jgi:hypothetical protein
MLLYVLCIVSRVTSLTISCYCVSFGHAGETRSLSLFVLLQVALPRHLSCFCGASRKFGNALSAEFLRFIINYHWRFISLVDAAIRSVTCFRIIT